MTRKFFWGAIAIWAARKHFAREVRPYAEGKGDHRSGVKEAMHRSMSRLFDQAWPAADRGYPMTEPNLTADLIDATLNTIIAHGGGYRAPITSGGCHVIVLPDGEEIAHKHLPTAIGAAWAIIAADAAFYGDEECRTQCKSCY